MMRATRHNTFALAASVGIRPPARAFSNQTILDRIRLNLLTAPRKQTLKHQIFTQRDKFSKTFAAAQKDILAAMLANDWASKELRNTRQAIAPLPIDQFLVYSQMLWRSDLGTVAPNPPSINAGRGDMNPQPHE